MGYDKDYFGITNFASSYITLYLAYHWLRSRWESLLRYCGFGCVFARLVQYKSEWESFWKRRIYCTCTFANVTHRFSPVHWFAWVGHHSMCNEAQHIYVGRNLCKVVFICQYKECGKLCWGFETMPFHLCWLVIGTGSRLTAWNAINSDMRNWLRTNMN